MNLLFEGMKASSDVMPLLFAELGREPQPERVERGKTCVADAAACDLEDVQRALELERAVEQGREEMRAELEQRLHDGVETERSAVSHVCASFHKAREKYFGEIEGEVVRLALAVAGRVLQREATLDPLLLTGVVRVALGKLNDAEGTVLHIPAVDVDRWRAAMRVVPSLRIEGDAAMATGDCRLEAPAGVAELGVKAQLVEIERGFFDLLARRPA